MSPPYFPFLGLFLISILSFQPVSSQQEGIATYYERPYTPSACYGFKNDGAMVAQVSETMYDNGNVCGKTYSVTCLGVTEENPDFSNPCIKDHETVTVKIVDTCSGCASNGIVLSVDAFRMIAKESVGDIRISYNEIPSS